MHRLWLGLGLTLIAATGMARADSLTQTFTFAPLAGYSGEAGTSFAQFNPALGTLTSLTLNFSATATFSGGQYSDFNDAQYQIDLGGFDEETADALSFGDGMSDASISDYTYNCCGYLPEYTGVGEITTAVYVVDNFGTPASVSSTFGTESLTYNYTPAPAIATTPEPGSIALLATGILGLASRRFRYQR